MKDLVFFLPLARGQVGRLFATLALAVATLAFGVALLGTSGWFLTAAAITTSAAAFNLFGPSALVRGFSLMRILSRYGERLVGHDATLRLLADIRAWLFASLFPRVPIAGFRRGDLASRLTADVEALDTAFLTAIVPVLSALLLGGAVAAALLWLVPPAGFVYVVALLLAVLAVPVALVAGTRRAGGDAVAASAATRTAVLDGLDGHADLVALDAVQETERGLADAARGLGRARRRMAGGAALAAAAVQTLTGTALAGILWFGLEALSEGRISGPVLVGLLLAVLGSFEATGAIVRSVAKLGTATAAARRLRALAMTLPAIAEPERPSPLPASGTFHLSGITFGYDPSRPVLRDLDLTVEAGERVAILGPSGSGKSTLVALLLRLADPQAGAVRFGGVDLPAAPLGNVHRRIALLSQDAPVFSDTLRGNLLIGHPEATDAELWAALEAARLADHVRSLPAGLQTWLGEAGRTLSAGEARRLCLARVLLSGAAVIVLDEPTSGLDRPTEAAFLADLAAATRGCTVVLVTHADLPAGSVDRCYRLSDGRLVEG